MWNRIVEPLFFSNYYLGLLAVALSAETSFQLSLPLNSFLWYGMLFAAVVFYYTHAYSSVNFQGTAANPRHEWYRRHSNGVKTSQSFLLLAFIVFFVVFVARYGLRLTNLPWPLWAISVGAVLAAIAYYGKLPLVNLRNAGWTKPVTIGFCWAACVSIGPVVALQSETGFLEISWLLSAWLFLKNWMFCSVNAILFDIKDFEDDSNQQLKTFVVRYGIRFTLLFILVPMILLGILSFLFFAYFSDFDPVRIVINLFPFLLTLYIAVNMQNPRPILYYLIVIDGMLLVKAICGIAGTLWSGG